MSFIARQLREPTMQPTITSNPDELTRQPSYPGQDLGQAGLSSKPSLISRVHKGSSLGDKSCHRLQKVSPILPKHQTGCEFQSPQNCATTSNVQDADDA